MLLRGAPAVVLLCLLWGCGDGASEPGATGACAAVETPPAQGGSHLIGDQEPPVPYNSTPPTSGWHSSGGFEIGVRGPTEALTEPQQVSALEAGAVVVTYGELPLTEINRLEEAVSRDYPGRVVTTPYDRLGDGEVAFTAWATLQRCDAIDLEALAAFVETYADAEPAPPGEH